MPTEADQKRAKEQTRSQLDSIVEMVKRLKHTEDCDGGDECDLPDQEILGGIGTFYREGMKASEQDKTQYHDRDEATEAISEDPLSLEVRSSWHAPGDKEATPDEYNLLLCTGGPAVRVIGDLDEHQMPTTARIEYQDWFTPWVEYRDTTSEEDEALLTYVQQFYFGE